MDDDLESLGRDQLVAEVKRLRTDIRVHRASRVTICVGIIRSSGASPERGLPDAPVADVESE